MDIQNLVESLAQRLEMPVPASDENGAYTFVFDGMPVHCRSGPDQRLILWGGLGEIPPDPTQAEEQAREILKANLAWMKTRKEIVCIDPESGEMVLYLSLKIPDLDVDRFEEKIEGLVNSLEFWLERAKTFSAPAPSPFTGIMP
jgi:hypothetical protein